MIAFIHVPVSHPLRPFGEKVLEDSFPEEERPDVRQLNGRDTTLFHFDIILQDEQPVGILTHWDFADFTYVEHFAIETQKRNHHIGSEALTLFSSTNKTIVLEAEPPTTPTARRRIFFYERHGLSVLPFDYIQPSYREGGAEVSLKILTNKEISSKDFQTIKNTLYKEVYKVSQ